MACVVHGWVAACRAASAGEAALRGAGAAWLGRVEDCSAAVAADVFEYGFGTAGAGAAVAEVLAAMEAAFEWAVAVLDADVLCFDGGCVGRGDPVLAHTSETLDRLLFTGTAVLAAVVPATTELCLAEAEAQRDLHVALVTDGLGRYPATAAGNLDVLAAEVDAVPAMAGVGAWVATGKRLLTASVAVGDGIRAGRTGLGLDLV